MNISPRPSLAPPSLGNSSMLTEPSLPPGGDIPSIGSDDIPGAGISDIPSIGTDVIPDSGTPTSALPVVDAGGTAHNVALPRRVGGKMVGRLRRCPCCCSAPRVLP